MALENRASLPTHSTQAEEKRNTPVEKSALGSTCLLSDQWTTQHHSPLHDLGTMGHNDSSPALSLPARVGQQEAW